MDELDSILRYSAFGLLLWLAVLAMRDFCTRMTGKLGALSAITAAAYLLTSKPGLHIFGVDLDLILLPLCAFGPAISWLFCLSQFDDNFEISPPLLTVAAIKWVTGVGAYLAWKLDWAYLAKPFYAVSSMVALGIVVHLSYVAWRGRQEDLMEGRRRFRTVFSAVIVFLALSILVGETLALHHGLEPVLLPLQAAGILGVALFMHWQLSGPNGVDIFVLPVEDKAAQQADRPADLHDIRALERLVSEGVYLESGLTITRLAELAGLPEHRLRRLINQELGYRNFSDYLNHHRIAAAKDRLARVPERNIPVLTIAMDLGYLSLGPFNRAFKERTGQTPTEFRRQALADF